MPDPAQDVRQELRRYLRQRQDAGESVVLLPDPVGRAGSSDEPAGGPAARSGSEKGGGSAPAERGGRAAARLPDLFAAVLEPPPGPARAPAASVPAAVPAAPESGDDSLERIAAEVRGCTRCKLHQTRTQAVPGVGPGDADLVFVGEGPGADEDARGEPFVGRAGQLLTKIIESVKLRRADVFITNIVKCRPPDNRDPEPDEVAACVPYLERQLRLLQPKVICALGKPASAALTGRALSMTALRAGEHYYRGIRVFPTFHPAALLRNSQWKRPVWEDIQNVRREYDAQREKS